VAGGLVVFGTINDTLHAVDATSGERAWIFEIGDDVDSSPAVVDGTVFVGSNDATVYAIGS
jgi:outer membrane protein assembly factor BamB